jgi:hypothetical protein
MALISRRSLQALLQTGAKSFKTCKTKRHEERNEKVKSDAKCKVALRLSFDYLFIAGIISRAIFPA